MEWQEGHPADKNPVFVPVSLSFMRALAHPGYPGLKGRKTVVCLHMSSHMFTSNPEAVLSKPMMKSPYIVQLLSYGRNL